MKIIKTISRKLLFTLASLSFCLMCSGIKKPIIPYQVGEYVPIYSPSSDTFPGPDTYYLKTGQWYRNWVANDHSFIKGKEGRWHLIGITHPLTPLTRVHDGEHQLFHAVSKKGRLKALLIKNSWKDQAKLLPPSERPGEMLPGNSPYIVKKDDLYYMIYGPGSIRYAVSEDLYHWFPKGSLFVEPKGARDPNVLLFDGFYYLSYCSENKVLMRTSDDLSHWSKAKVIYEAKTFEPESPVLIYRKGSFYLFVCAWDKKIRNTKIQNAYQHKTYVYTSDSLDKKFEVDECLGILNAHAPEIIQDEVGDWYMSSVEYPYRGVSVCKIDWK